MLFHSSHLHSASQLRQEASYSRNKIHSKGQEHIEIQNKIASCFVMLENRKSTGIPSYLQ